MLRQILSISIKLQLKCCAEFCIHRSFATWQIYMNNHFTPLNFPINIPKIQISFKNLYKPLNFANANTFYSACWNMILAVSRRPRFLKFFKLLTNTREKRKILAENVFSSLGYDFLTIYLKYKLKYLIKHKSKVKPKTQSPAAKYLIKSLKFINFVHFQNKSNSINAFFIEVLGFI